MVALGIPFRRRRLGECSCSGWDGGGCPFVGLRFAGHYLDGRNEFSRGIGIAAHHEMMYLGLTKVAFSELQRMSATDR